MNDDTDKLEQEVIDELNEKIGEPSGNPFAAYCVQFPYRVEMTLPEDDHNTRIQIDTKSEEVTFARSEEDARLAHELTQRHSRRVYCKHITDFARDNMWHVDPENMTITFLDKPSVTKLTDEEVGAYEREVVEL